MNFVTNIIFLLLKLSGRTRGAERKKERQDGLKKYFNEWIKYEIVTAQLCSFKVQRRRSDHCS